MLARLLLLNQVISRLAPDGGPAGKGDQMDVLGKNPLRVGLTVAICLGAIVGLVGCDRRTAEGGASPRTEAAPIDGASGRTAPLVESPTGRSSTAGAVSKV